MKDLIIGCLLTIFLFAAHSNGQINEREKIWEQEIGAFAEIDRRQTPPDDAVLFIGSSSVRLWTNLRQNFPGLKVINRGFGGSRLEDVNFFFDRIVLPYKPKMIVLYAGENDVNDAIAPEIVLDNYRQFSKTVQAKLPKTKILYVSLKPSPARWKLADNFRKTNELIKAEIAKDKRAQFVDVWTAMLGANGEPMADIFIEDKLHMNEKGYAIWRGVLEKYLK